MRSFFQERPSLNTWRHSLELADAVTWTKAIKASGKWNLAFGMLESLEKKRIQKDAGTQLSSVFFTGCVLIQYLFELKNPWPNVRCCHFFWHLFLNSGKDVVLCNTVITCCEKISQWSHGLHLLVTLQECLDLRVRNQFITTWKLKVGYCFPNDCSFFSIENIGPQKMGLKKLGFRSKLFHYLHKRPAPS